MTARLANTYSESARSRGVSGLEALQSDFILSRPSGKSHRGPVLIKAPQWLTHTIWVLLASQQLELLRYSTSFPMSSKVLLCVCASVREWRLTLGTGTSVYIKLALWLVGFQACGDGFGLPKRLSWQTSTILYLPRSRPGAVNHSLPQASKWRRNYIWHLSLQQKPKIQRCLYAAKAPNFPGKADWREKKSRL